MSTNTRFRVMASTSALLILSACAGPEDQQRAGNSNADTDIGMEEMSMTLAVDSPSTEIVQMQHLNQDESYSGLGQTDDSEQLPTSTVRPAQKRETVDGHADGSGHAKELPTLTE